MNKIIDYLKDEKRQFQLLVSDFLDSQLSKYGSLTPDYSYTLQNIKQNLLQGGKWHRPALTLLAFRASGGTVTQEIRMAAIAMEVLHRFLLIHDDIIDRDLTRHQIPTLEKIYQDRFKERYPSKTDTIYSQGMAMVSGDIVFSLAYELLASSKLDPKIILNTIQAINQLMMETAAGWQLETDQNYMTLDEVTIPDYFTGMKLVSAQYSVVWPLRVGQIFAGRNLSEYDPEFEAYGLNTGLAFQITDDVLGMFGDPKVTGKPVGHDYREGKKTLLVLDAYRKSKNEDKEFIISTLGHEVDQDTLQRIQKLMKESGALTFSEQAICKHCQQAHEALSKLESVDQVATSLLGQLVDFLAHRSY